MIAPFIGFLVFVVIGISLIKFSQTIRKYDTRMTRYIKDESNYVMMCFVIGVMFLVGSLVPLMFAIIYLISN